MTRVVLALLALVLTTAPALAGTVRVGAAAENITPPLGTPLGGYFNARNAKSVLDDLYAKAIVVEQDGVKFAMVVCDQLTLPRPITEEARKLITAATGIPGDHVMISATHTHTGALIWRNSSQDPAGDDASKAKAFTDSLPEHIKASVVKANEKLTPVKVSFGAGHREGISFNRRFFMKDGTVAWNPGKQNPDVVKPAGPIDPEVAVVSFQSVDGGKPLATYVNFALHPDTVGGENISADYPGVLSRFLVEKMGPEVFTIFSNGACGDVNHIDVNVGNVKGIDSTTNRTGIALGEETLKTLSNLTPAGGGPIRTKSAIVSLPLPEFTTAEVEAARDVLLKPAKRKMLDRVNAFKTLDVAARKGKPIEAEVQVIALGDDIAWVALPGEIFVELGLDVKKRSPFKRTIIVELANGSVGYIPTKRAYAEGNYEPISARPAAGCGELIVEAAVKLLNEVKSQK